jgi:hypothetical protein
MIDIYLLITAMILFEKVDRKAAHFRPPTTQLPIPGTGE